MRSRIKLSRDKVRSKEADSGYVLRKADSRKQKRHRERQDENQECERLWSTSGRKLFNKGGMIHIKGRQQAGKEASECARNNNCASAHVVFPLPLQHRPLYISSVNSSGQRPGPPPCLVVQAVVCHSYQEYELDECACVLLNTKGYTSPKPHCR